MVFGRYPVEPNGNTYPVIDLVICHGDFLNADHDCVHKNKSIKGFGSYGDIMIRDRKTYVVPTPFSLVEGVAHTQTLILPHDMLGPEGYVHVGTLVRTEAEQLIVGYEFDLLANTLSGKTIMNPSAGKEHTFRAWRLAGSPLQPVSLRPAARVLAELEGQDPSGQDNGEGSAGE